MIKKALIALIIIASVSMLFFYVAKFWHFTADDTFIYFRYSDNLASGYGPVYNPGAKPPEEGYTSFMWMLLMTVPHLFGVDAVIATKIIGIVLTVAVGVLCFLFASSLSPSIADADRYIAAATAVLMLAAFPATGVHAVAGMETALFTFMLTLFLYMAYRFTENSGGRRAYVLMGLALLLGLNRPEGNLVAGIVTVMLLFMVPADARKRLVSGAIIFYIIPGGLYFLWRYNYYGVLLPLPFYVKVSSFKTPFGKPQVVSFIIFMLKHVGVFFLIGFASHLRRALPAAVALGAFTVFFLFPVHVMGYDWRYVYPVAPFSFVLSGAGIATIASWINRRVSAGWAGPYASTAFFLSVCIVIPFFLFGGFQKTYVQKMLYANGLYNAHTKLAFALRNYQAPQGSTPVLAISDAGVVPYYSKWKTIDTYGLNQPHIAVTKDYSPEYVFSWDPDVVVLISRSKESFEVTSSHLFYESDLYGACRRKGMSRVRMLTFAKNYYLWVMAYPGTPIYKHLSYNL